MAEPGEQPHIDVSGAPKLVEAWQKDPLKAEIAIIRAVLTKSSKIDTTKTSAIAQILEMASKVSSSGVAVLRQQIKNLSPEVDAEIEATIQALKAAGSKN